MPYQLRFEHLLEYDVGQTGIPVPVMLRLNDRVVDIAAKLDPGASDCIFEREHGLALGLDIESGVLKKFQHCNWELRGIRPYGRPFCAKYRV
jgi:hypothetical protein